MLTKVVSTKHTFLSQRKNLYSCEEKIIPTMVSNPFEV